MFRLCDNRKAFFLSASHGKRLSCYRANLLDRNSKKNSMKLWIHATLIQYIISNILSNKCAHSFKYFLQEISPPSAVFGMEIKICFTIMSNGFYWRVTRMEKDIFLILNLIPRPVNYDTFFHTDSHEIYYNILNLCRWANFSFSCVTLSRNITWRSVGSKIRTSTATREKTYWKPQNAQYLLQCDVDCQDDGTRSNFFEKI